MHKQLNINSMKFQWPMYAAISFQITTLHHFFYLVVFLSRLQSLPKQVYSRNFSFPTHIRNISDTQNIINKTDEKINQTDYMRAEKCKFKFQVCSKVAVCEQRGCDSGRWTACHSQLNVGCHSAPPRHLLLEDTLENRSFTSLICGSGLFREVGQSKFKRKHFSKLYTSWNRVKFFL